MYAIVDIAGQQFKVEKDQKLYVHRLEGEEGKKVSFDKVLLIDTGSKVSVGEPVVKGASVDAKIVTHVKGDKVLVFKKKRRKGYQKLNGHRQQFTQIQIEGISEKAAAKPKAAAEKQPKDPSKAKNEAPAKPAETKKAATAAKKPAAKAATTQAKEAKPVAKKPAAKKAAPKKEESGEK